MLPSSIQTPVTAELFDSSWFCSKAKSLGLDLVTISDNDINEFCNLLKAVTVSMTNKDTKLTFSVSGVSCCKKLERNYELQISLLPIAACKDWSFGTKVVFGLLIHEIGHTIFPAKMSADRSHNSFEQRVHNIFNDRYMESRVAKSFPGYQRLLEASRTFYGVMSKAPVMKGALLKLLYQYLTYKILFSCVKTDYSDAFNNFSSLFESKMKELLGDHTFSKFMNFVNTPVLTVAGINNAVNFINETFSSMLNDYIDLMPEPEMPKEPEHDDSQDSDDSQDLQQDDSQDSDSTDSDASQDSDTTNSDECEDNDSKSDDNEGDSQDSTQDSTSSDLSDDSTDKDSDSSDEGSDEDNDSDSDNANTDVDDNTETDDSTETDDTDDADDTTETDDTDDDNSDKTGDCDDDADGDSSDKMGDTEDSSDLEDDSNECDTPDSSDSDACDSDDSSDDADKSSDKEDTSIRSSILDGSIPEFDEDELTDSKSVMDSVLGSLLDSDSFKDLKDLADELQESFSDDSETLDVKGAPSFQVDIDDNIPLEADELYFDYKELSRFLQPVLTKISRTNGRMSTAYGMDEGDIDEDELATARCNRNIFKASKAGKGYYSEMIVLQDLSGSMCADTRLRDSGKLLSALIDVFHDSSIVDFRAYGFTAQLTGHSGSVLYPISTESISKKKALYTASHLQALSENIDYDVIQEVSKMFKPGKHDKLIIMLSDGQPCACHIDMGAAIKKVRNVVTNLSKDGIKVISVGVGDFTKAQSRMYDIYFPFSNHVSQDLVSWMKSNLRKKM